MDRFSNIFYNVTQENEDTTSELLCNIFRTKYVRDLSLKFLGIPLKTLNAITLDNISTRKSIDGIGIPDIIIENEETCFFIENKIHISTNLQGSQITTYPEYINKKNKTYKGYVFLIPKNYQHEPEIDELKKNYSFISKVYWDDFLGYLYKNEINNGTPILNEVLDCLSNLILNDSIVNTKLNISEVVIMYNTKDLYNTLTFVDKINKLVGKTAEDIVTILGQDFSMGDEQKDQNGYGRYLKYNNRQSIFYGLNPGLYEEQNGDFVYSVAIEKKAMKAGTNIDNNKYQYFPNGDDVWVYIKIDRKTLVDNEQENTLVNIVVDIVKNVFLKNL